MPIFLKSNELDQELQQDGKLGGFDGKRKDCKRKIALCLLSAEYIVYLIQSCTILYLLQQFVEMV